GGGGGGGLRGGGVREGRGGRGGAPEGTVQDDDGVRGQGGGGGHVPPGARHRRPLGTRREKACRGRYQSGGDVGPRRDVCGRVIRDRRAQRVHSLQVCRDELAIVQLLLEDHPDHAGEERGILAPADLEMQGGAARQLGPPRVDRDDLHPAAARVAQVLEGVGVRRPAVARERGNAG